MSLQNLTTKNQVAIDFDKILSLPGSNENAIQKHLEANTDLIPLPWLLNHNLHFNFIFSKLPIGGEYICDFAYLTKSSDRWQVVLVELEGSNKSIFTNSRGNPVFTAEFNNAFDQVLSWKAYLENNIASFKSSLQPLLAPLEQNPIEPRFVLVIGRSSELNTEPRMAMFKQKHADDFFVLTYDSLIRRYNAHKRQFKNIVAKVKNGFELRSINNSTNAFSYLNSNQLFLTGDVRNKLIAQHYDIIAWENGQFLNLSGAVTSGIFNGDDFRIINTDD